MSLTAGKQLLLTSGAGATGYQISRSLRFNSPDSAYLSRTPASAGNRRTFTFAFWYKRSNVSTSVEQAVFTTNTTYDGIRFENNSDKLRFFLNGASSADITTTQVFRDPSAWYHFVIAVDTTQATASNRVKLYVNGSQITTFDTSTYPSQNYDCSFNSTNQHVIGYSPTAGTHYLNGFLADCYLIDGQQLDPSSFTTTDATTGQLIPKAFSGTYGTNGFHLDFADNSAATATTLGKDTSGNGNNWTPNNLSIGTYPFSGTVSTNNGNFTSGQGPYYGFDGNTGTFCSAETAGNAGGYMDINVPAWGKTGSVEILANTQVYYSVNGATAVALGASWTSIGNAESITTLRLTRPGTTNTPGFYAIRVAGAELIDDAKGNDSLVDVPTNGTASSGADPGGSTRGNYCTWNPTDTDGSVSYVNGNLEAAVTNGSANSTYGTFSLTSGKWYWEIVISGGNGSSSMIGVAEANKGTARRWTGANGWYYYETGVLYNNLSSTSYGSSYTNGDVIGVALDMDNGNLVFYKNNTSQGTAYSSGTFSGKTIMPAVGNGGSATVTYTLNAGARSFAYTAPSGYKALCTANLPAPLVTKPNTVFDTVLWTGNDTGQTITMPGAFSPDFVWTKMRSAANAHWLFDVVRGANQGISSSSTNAESTRSSTVTAFGSTGFTLGTSADVNSSAYTYVAWTWDAGSSTVTNTQGSITSSVRANATAGFSVVTYTGTGANATIGHGGLVNLSNGMIITKNRSSATNWRVYHSALGNTKVIFLSTTGTPDTNSVYWNNTSPTSTVFSVGSDDGVNGNGNSMVAYCFAPVVGYSNAFSYTGNGSSDGPMVWLGFRPRLILLKRTDSSNNWILVDSARDTYNSARYQLLPNVSDSEYTVVDTLDILSNGFKLRDTNASRNASGGTYIGFAWAESPFNYARAR